jgi:hypothetical protein
MLRLLFIDAISFLNNTLQQPTAFEMRQKNEKFAKDAKAGKKPTHLSRQEKLQRKSPINLYALAAVVFVVVGGGMCSTTGYLKNPLTYLFSSILRNSSIDVPVKGINYTVSFLICPGF